MFKRNELKSLLLGTAYLKICQIHEYESFTAAHVVVWLIPRPLWQKHEAITVDPCMEINLCCQTKI